jgi:hypothetical protein
MAVIGVGRRLREPDCQRSLVLAIYARATEILGWTKILLFHALLKFSLTQDTCFMGCFTVPYFSTQK